jgi:site-specific DNA recombinase
LLYQCGAKAANELDGHRGEPRVQCSTYREIGSCTNSRMVNRNKIEAAVLDGLREVLKDPDYFTVYQRHTTRSARGLPGGSRTARSSNAV